jgi:hypothetical protein
VGDGPIAVSAASTTAMSAARRMSYWTWTAQCASEMSWPPASEAETTWQAKLVAVGRMDSGTQSNVTVVNVPGS